MGRGAAKPFGRAFGRASVELLQSFVWSFVQSFFRAQCFEVRHVNSATTYRAQFFSIQSKAGLANFLNQLRASLAKFEIQDPKVIDHSYLGSMNAPLQLIDNLWRS